MEGQIDVSQMASGDSVVIKTYIAVDGANQRLSDSVTLTGAQSIPIIRVLAHTLAYNAKFRVTVTQTAGTIRTFYYTFITEVMEVI
ncbi:MAG: hypothetical protein B9J98_08175 [Candidatus Terraquivivens tikiterensis]|uniref:Uncharacterized protein n=1 Tax=Candidatus Terraquivivens tikiterensis TaxID=1980982 RepID=A0A2R7Y0G9_9ARCH|nr:MAG: hypothetical protein B9J98_08175 [Candidatus Terraquivivens tikiterensis]